MCYIHIVNIILSNQELISKAKHVLLDIVGDVPLHPDSMMVGGTIRDIMLGRTPQDIDITTPDTTGFVEELSNKGFTHVLMDSDRDIHRMVKEGTHVDITLLKERAEIDLLTRDFAINSIGIIIKNWKIIDPQRGIPDLSKGIIRTLNEERFINDPLRMIRAFRLAAELSFNIDPVTLRMITKNAHLINKPSKERIRDELCRTLAVQGSFNLIEKLKQSHLLERILPELAKLNLTPTGKAHITGLTEHLLWTYKYFEDVMNNLDDVLLEYSDSARELLCKKISGGHSLLVLTKLAALLHDVGKPKTMTNDKDVHFIGHDDVGAEMIASRMKILRFSSAEIEVTSTLIRQHMRPHNLAKLDKVTRRAVYRFFRDLGDLSIPCLLIALADAYATEMLSWGLLEAYADFMRSMVAAAKEIGKPKPLLSGDDIINKLKLKPGPIIGQIQSDLLEAQALKNVSTKDDAFSFIKERYDSNEYNS